MSALPDAAPRDGLPGGSSFGCRHLLVIYADDEQLHAAVAEQMAGPLRSGDSVVVVATPEHRAGFRASLARAGSSVHELRASGRYVELDADELLAHVLADGSVDGRRLVPLAEEFEAAARAAGGRLLVVSELAPMLWARGLVVAALEMEAVGSRLAGLYDVELLCLYPNDAFCVDGAVDYPTLCAHHSEVVGDAEAPVENGSWEGLLDGHHRAGEGLCTLDAEGRIAYVNPAGEQLLGVPIGAALGGFLGEWLFLVQSEATEVRSGRPSARPEGTAGEGGEARLLRADGTSLPIEYVAASLPVAQDGQATGWIVTFRDITHRHEQQQLRADAEHGHR